MVQSILHNLGSWKSPECKTIKKSLPDICTHFNNNQSAIAPLADSLEAAGIITAIVCSDVKYAREIGPYRQASQLLDSVRSTIQFLPRKFYEFLEILRKQGHGNLAQELYQKCSKCNNANASHYYMCIQYQRKVCS